MKLVSIILGAYNGSKYIETQLRSVINQTYKNVEIIIADDASNDNTVAIASTIAKEHHNISVHSFQNNVGYIKNFERGMELAKGELIALCDQDDWWHPTKIEKLVNNIENHDIIYCDSEFTNEGLEPNGKSFSRTKNMLNSINPLNFVVENCVSGHASLIQKTLFDKAKPFPELIPHDWWLAFMATLNNGVTYFDEPLVKYRFHDTNVIVSKKKKVNKQEKNIERRHRIHQFYLAIPNNSNEKKILKKIDDSYEDFSLANNINRVQVFLEHRENLLAILKKSYFKKVVFAYNMFFKIK